MRLLLIGDSHTREMNTHIQATHPDIDVMLVTVPRSITDITAHFMSHARPNAIVFFPHWIILHCGHNDVVVHKYYNKNPQFAGNVAIQQVQFAQTLQALFPSASVMCSSIFPRSFTDKTNLSSDDTAGYNKIAKRYGLRLRQLSTPHRIRCSLNMVMWTQVSRAKENKDLISTDGLHLKDAGKVQVGAEWVRVLKEL
jgi:lysophospholipase L1-like esterase